ncbi:DUF4097 family beta strand repeat protein [Streptomyces roseirectus]|uniref:DUF4097 family beta strand repeat protein n=1 Tax=Streptomyces roseirectus TaxID=2768066 RepID=A0A7H0IER9_9ACTN|nr:DUF4097 family beta strand repeat-containing protein [Streptomyces roseirectus]QNP71285.1 DUF4097 family beta strand repeat protein [Streptomyces roseirectus]
MHTFTTPTPITTHITLPAGRIQLIAADRPDTTVTIRPANPTKTRDQKTADQITATYDNTTNTLRIEAPEPKNALLGHTGAVEITVQLPTGSHLHATTQATELRGVGRLGTVTHTGGYHTVKLDEADNAHLTAHDADITIKRLTGPAHLTTQRGTLHITEATTGTLTLTTQQGDIHIGTTPTTNATLDASTNHGRITNSLKNNGNPTLTITATTTHGNITAHTL